MIWSLDTSSDLNANLVRLGTGGGVGEHANDEDEVIIVGVPGSGIITVDREKLPLSSGMPVFIPKGARQATVGTSENFVYLAVHLRRRPLQIGFRQGA